MPPSDAAASLPRPLRVALFAWAVRVIAGRKRAAAAARRLASPIDRCPPAPPAPAA
jgi:hypothetical protein